MPATGQAIDVQGVTLWVGQELGRGGEGIVLALVDRHGQPSLALKWYHHHEPWRRVLLEHLVDRGSPNDRYLWPRAMIYGPGDSFGYVMDLRPAGYVPVSMLLKGKVERREEQVLSLSLDVAQSFLALHLFGFCYRDVNYNNALFDPSTGRVLICDNDNVGVDSRSSSKVLGVPQFMAPEVIRGEVLPSRVTDHHSLAVLLFYLLLVAHPLEGLNVDSWHGLWDDDAKRHFYGHQPTFIFDPADVRNRPDPDIAAHVFEYWGCLPSVLRRHFLQAFTDGLHDPEARVQDSEWCDALLRARGELWKCPSCSRVDYLDCVVYRCRGCGMAPSAVLKLNGFRLVVSALTEVTRNHLSLGFDDPTPLGTAEVHPSRPDLIGLRNDTDAPWRAVDQAGVTHWIEPGRRVRLTHGMRIEIAGTWALVDPQLR